MRSGDVTIPALEFLAHCGVKLDEALPDGRTALHLAAELASTVSPLAHLCQKYGMGNIDRRDQWGWTALHYAVGSYSNREDNLPCGKVRFLLEKGADPHLRGNGLRTRPLHVSNWVGEPVSPLEYSKYLGPDVYNRFVADMRAAGHAVADEEDGEQDEFHDAVESIV